MENKIGIGANQIIVFVDADKITGCCPSVLLSS